MTTPHVLDQLPHWVEGDLLAPELAAIEVHLTECPACRSAAEQLKTSQAWLREALASPFEAADEARLRGKVMEQLRAESTPRSVRPFVTRPTLLAACAAALLIITLSWHQAPRVVPPPPLASQPPGPPTTPHQEATATLPQPAPARVAPSREAHLPLERPILPHEEPARIELQTADPTVRIIWLAQAKPMPESTSPLTEAP